MKDLLSLLIIFFLTSCSTANIANIKNSETEIDPFEARDTLKPLNKKIFSLNLALDETIIGPVAHTYHHVPEWGRRHINNFLTNLDEPLNFVNGLLQARPDIAFASFWRFILNTTIGFGGVNDFASKAGLKHYDEGFSKTLGSYGVDEGIYLVLPVIGPSSVRDTTGLVADWFLDPLGWLMNTTETITQITMDGITTRDNEDAVIEQFYYDSIEPYSATRAAYLQHSAFKH